MRISMNAKRMQGSWGGLNQFANALEDRLVADGHYVTRTLEPGLDVIFILVAQPELSMCSYHPGYIGEYRKTNNPVVVHRINTCDEQRGKDLGINRAVLAANQHANATVFVGKYIQQMYDGKGIKGQLSVIRNGADESVFNPDGRAVYDGTGPLKIVTHHWSTNAMKGFDTYQWLEEQLKDRTDIEFTYIGRLPEGMHLTRHVQPTHGQDLASKLKEHHLYLTASLMESGPNHPVEAMRCGLPVFYEIGPGAMREYCDPKWSRGFSRHELMGLLEFHKNKQAYDMLHEAVLECDMSSAKCANEYTELFMGLLEERN